MAKEPASIRFKNPGAMWGNALARKWGAANAVTLNDGLGQGNNIAVFPTYVQGICAQLDLWRTSSNYKNKRFADAIKIWSGGNYVESYISFVLSRVPGMTRNTIMNDDFWHSPNGIAFLKAQAWHEAGKKYPAPDADWIEAQRRVFDSSKPVRMVGPPAEIDQMDTDSADKAQVDPALSPAPPATTTVVTARTAAGTGAAVVAGGQVIATAIGGAGDVAEKTTDLIDKSGQIISTSKQMVTIPKPGFWGGVLHFVTSPEFVVIAVLFIAAMWALVWFIQRNHKPPEG